MKVKDSAIEEYRARGHFWLGIGQSQEDLGARAGTDNAPQHVIRNGGRGKMNKTIRYIAEYSFFKANSYSTSVNVTVILQTWSNVITTFFINVAVSFNRKNNFPLLYNLLEYLSKNPLWNEPLVFYLDSSSTSKAESYRFPVLHLLKVNVQNLPISLIN